MESDVSDVMERNVEGMMIMPYAAMFCILPERVELTLMIGQNSPMDNQGSTTPGTTPIEDKQNTRKKIIQIIKSTPNVSSLGLAKMCDITKDGAKYHLTKLKKEGKIRYSKEDGGIWIINE